MQLKNNEQHLIDAKFFDLQNLFKQKEQEYRNDLQEMEDGKISMINKMTQLKTTLEKKLNDLAETNKLREH